MSKYFLKPKYSGKRAKFELDLSNYGTKSNLFIYLLLRLFLSHSHIYRNRLFRPLAYKFYKT